MKLAGGAHVFALTGGIGSGKSAVASIWRESGLPVVDADCLARDVVRAGSPGLKQVVEQFGGEMLQKDGELDRAKLGATVFHDPEARGRLNAIVHPLVRDAAEKCFLEQEREGAKLICYEIPLLFETKQERRFRPVVVVGATPLQQMERIAARDGLSPDEVAARLRAQIPLQQKEEQADILIPNSGTREALRSRAEHALQEVRSYVERESSGA